MGDNVVGGGAPRATLQWVWDQRNAWAYTARVGKERFERARNAALALVGCGAAFGAIVGLVPDASGLVRDASGLVRDDSNVLIMALASLSALCIAIGGWTGREFLAPRDEQAWARARYRAEALQREVWRALTGATPYHEGDPGAVLRQRIEEVLTAEAGECLEPPPTAKPAPLPECRTFEDYRTGRVRGQIGFYKDRVRTFQGRRHRLRNLMLLLGLASVVAGLAGMREESLAGLVPFFAALVASVRLAVESSRFDAIIPLYQRTEHQLGLLDAEWAGREERAANLDEATRAALQRAYVDAVERLIEQENQAWRADVMNEERAKQLFDAVQAAAEARKPPPSGGGGADPAPGKPQAQVSGGAAQASDVN